jgi:hypothetical protein
MQRIVKLADLITDNLLRGAIVSGELGSSASFTSFLSQQGSGVASSQPKAYLNILFFDERFKFVEQGSEVIPIVDCYLKKGT